MIDQDLGAHVVVESMDLVRDSARPDDHRRTDLRIAVGARVFEIDISCVYQNQNNTPTVRYQFGTFTNSKSLLAARDREKNRKHAVRCQRRGHEFFSFAITPLGAFSPDARRFLRVLSGMAVEYGGRQRWWFYQHFVPKLKLLIRQSVHRQLRHFVCQHRVNSGTCGGPGDLLDPALLGPPTGLVG